MPITKQTIAIIGADGDIGSIMAKRISGDNYRLLLLSKDISNVQPLAEEITQFNSSADIDVRDCKHDACWEADIIIMVVPYSAQEEVAEIIKEVATQKIVISISSEINAANELQTLLPNAKIVKIFNTDFTQAGKRVDAFIAGNNDEALKTVSELIETVGLNPVVAGNLPVSQK